VTSSIRLRGHGHRLGGELPLDAAVPTTPDLCQRSVTPLMDIQFYP